MDFFDRDLDLEGQRKQVEQALALMSRQVDEMDSKIRAFLADRNNKPHPRHLDLIEKIQAFRIPNSISTKHLTVLLDNLQWKLHYSKQAWSRVWEHAEKQIQKHPGASNESIAANPASDDGSMRQQSKAQYSVDTLWEIQQEKLRAYGHTDAQETKTEFKKRMIQEYKKLNQEKKKGQEIIMTFDADSHQCRLGVK